MTNFVVYELQLVLRHVAVTNIKIIIKLKNKQKNEPIVNQSFILAHSYTLIKSLHLNYIRFHPSIGNIEVVSQWAEF